MTAQMRESVTTELKVRGIIEVLRSLTIDGSKIDGETMQYIIEKVGMNDQMLRQLVMTNPESDTYDLLDEKVILNTSGLNNEVKLPDYMHPLNTHKRVKMVIDDLKAIEEVLSDNGIDINEIKSPYTEKLSTHFENIKISCNLESNECLEWERFTKD